MKLRTLGFSLLSLAASANATWAVTPNCTSFAGSLYSDGSVTGWDPFGGHRCDHIFTLWKSSGLSAVTFVFEHHKFLLSKKYQVSAIPASTIPHDSLVRCFSAALDRGMKINLKIQLPDTLKGPKGEFVWRHHYLIDLGGHYYDRMISPYLHALFDAVRDHDQKFPEQTTPEIRIIPLHELHTMLCSQPYAVEKMLGRLRNDLRSQGREAWKIGFSLDWQFFTDVNPKWDGDVHDVCLRAAPSVSRVLGATDFVGVGAYKPSGGDNGVIDSVDEGAEGFQSIYDDAKNTMAAYGLANLPMGISEWNGGGDDPNSWAKPATIPYQLAFRGALKEWNEQSLDLGFFTFWNVRSNDFDANEAIQIIAPELQGLRCEKND